MAPRDNGVKAEARKDRCSHPHEQADRGHRRVRVPHREEETDSDHGPVIRYSNGYAGAGNDGDTHHHHDEGYSHGSVVDHDDCCSSRHWKGNHRDGMVATENDDGVHFEELHFAPVWS